MEQHGYGPGITSTCWSAQEGLADRDSRRQAYRGIKLASRRWQQPNKGRDLDLRDTGVHGRTSKWHRPRRSDATERDRRNPAVQRCSVFTLRDDMKAHDGADPVIRILSCFSSYGVAASSSTYSHGGYMVSPIALASDLRTSLRN
jgi:hypothetical protein